MIWAKTFSSRLKSFEHEFVDVFRCNLICCCRRQVSQHRTGDLLPRNKHVTRVLVNNVECCAPLDPQTSLHYAQSGGVEKRRKMRSRPFCTKVAKKRVCNLFVLIFITELNWIVVWVLRWVLTTEISINRKAPAFKKKSAILPQKLNQK
jgi:hypothetical protein